MSNPQHECHEPAAEGDFDTDIAEEEDGAEPSDGVAEGLSSVAMLPRCVRRGIIGAVDGASGLPEGSHRGEKLYNCHADLKAMSNGRPEKFGVKIP